MPMAIHRASDKPAAELLRVLFTHEMKSMRDGRVLQRRANQRRTNSIE